MVSDCPYLSDEYCQREQVIRIDGVEVARFTPWRDCSGTCDLQSYDSPGGGAPETQYCLQNPMTDSAEGMTRARSNWCPSQGVVPTEIPLPELSAGEHTLEIEVSRIPAGSARWWVSAALLAP
jgi:hypothetical protein